MKRNTKKAASPLKNRGEITRLRLLDVAIRLFAEKGFEGTSVDEIVGAASVNKRMVYHYFGSKVDLYRECLAQIYSRPEKLETTVLSPDLSPEASLGAIVEAYFEFLAEEPEYVRLLLWENLNQGRALKHHQQLLSKAPLHALLAEVVKRGISQGVFRKNLDVDLLAISMIGLSFIYYSNRHTLSQGLNLDLSSPSVRKQALAFAKALLLNGVK